LNHNVIRDLFPTLEALLPMLRIFSAFIL